MKQKTIVFNVPNEQIQESIEYCQTRQEETNSGEIVIELKDANAYQECFVIVPAVSAPLHHIAVLYLTYR